MIGFVFRSSWLVVEAHDTDTAGYIKCIYIYTYTIEYII